MSDEPDQVIVVPRTDPVFSVFTWRSDSITMARLRPILDQLRDIPEEPCQIGSEPYACAALDDDVLCGPCQLRHIRFELFGTNQEQP